MVFPFDEEEELDVANPMVSDPPPEMTMGSPEPMAAQPIDPAVKEYLAKKFNLGAYNDDARKKLVDENSGYDIGGSIGAALAALGSGGAAGGLQALKHRQSERKGKIDEFDKGRSNKIQEYDLDNKYDKDQRDAAVRTEEGDPMSDRSKIAQSLASKMMPGQDFSQMSASKLNSMFPSMAKIYDVEQKKLDRQESRDERRALFGMKQQERKDAHEAKLEELSVPKAKQRGLYESGLKAEEQYRKAVADPDEYDPTGVGQIIDNSDWAPNILKNNKAIEAQAAQSAWIEAFLRDASGAAIPPSERGAYAKDFFPQPGDPKDVVANKEALRAQKMENAALGSGIKNADVASQFSKKSMGSEGKKVIKTQTNPKTGQKRVVYSDGTTEVIGSVARK